MTTTTRINDAIELLERRLETIDDSEAREVLRQRLTLLRSQPEADYTFSIDAGNGLVNAYKATRSGRISFDMFPSARAIMTGGTLEMGKFEHETATIEWRGTRYAVGDSVFDSHRFIERHNGGNRYGNEFHEFLIASAIARLKVRSGSVIDLVTYAPPGLYAGAKGVIIERLAGQTYTIQASDRQTPIEFTVRNVTVLPEAAAALLCFALDEKGRLQDASVLAGQAVILDAGLYTLDTLRVINGRIQAENIESATDEHGGIRRNILEPVLREVKLRGGDEFSLMTIDHIDRVLRKGMNETYMDAAGNARADYRLTSGSATMNIEPLIRAVSQTYAEYIANNVIDSTLNGLKGIAVVVMVGGGTSLVLELLRQWYGLKILDPDSVGVEPINLNAAGGLRAALHRANR